MFLVEIERKDFIYRRLQCHEDRGAREARFCNDVYKIVMASPGMLQNGLSRDLFDRWCQSEKNGVVFTGYLVDGTHAKHLLTEPTYINI